MKSFEALAAFLLLLGASAFVPSHHHLSQTTVSSSLNRFIKSHLFVESNDNEEAKRLQEKAETLREQIRSLEKQLNRNNPPRQQQSPPPPSKRDMETSSSTPTLVNKRILVAGANGRLGSMVCRYLLRNHPQTEVVAAVHVVGENSATARGYGRLQYEVGAEDGRGSIGAAWSAADERTATFEYDEQVMGEYNLRNLRIVEVELLDPLQCQSVCDESIDAVVWCATDFNGNLPRAISGLNVAFLFRAVSNPIKGRVEVEGLENMLGALKLAKQERKRQRGYDATNDPVNVVLVSTAPDALDDFETPFGSFLGIKRQGEELLDSFPSLTSIALQMSRYGDNFVEEGVDIQTQVATKGDASSVDDSSRRRINRRDAAKAVADALLDQELIGKTAQVWTAIR
ncbi:hypothetical protein MPSEU_000659000 [Mayamaea pseudoterrestris]|nr:hypothetical protein MPSEU_000659000 [Mayamaea pseudoterrestris]